MKQGNKWFSQQGIPFFELIRMRPKWGIDMSIDYVDDGNVFEVFHYEWDNFDYASVQKKEEIEEFALSVDWEDAAASLLKQRRMGWPIVFEMSKWKTDFLVKPRKLKIFVGEIMSKDPNYAVKIEKAIAEIWRRSNPKSKEDLERG